MDRDNYIIRKMPCLAMTICGEQTKNNQSPTNDNSSQFLWVSVNPNRMRQSCERKMREKKQLLPKTTETETVLFEKWKKKKSFYLDSTHCNFVDLNARVNSRCEHTLKSKRNQLEQTCVYRNTHTHIHMGTANIQYICMKRKNNSKYGEIRFFL